MKKSIATSLVGILMLMGTTPVFAATANTTLPSEEAYSNIIDITATTSGGDSYSVDVEWGDMTFEYTLGGWDTTEHKYTTNESPVWKEAEEGMTEEQIEAAIEAGQEYTLSSGQILVRNHSNQPITTEYTALEVSEKTEGFGDVKPSVTEGGEIDACPVLAQSGIKGVPYQTAKVTLSGAPTHRQQNVQVGTLTIEISK